MKEIKKTVTFDELKLDPLIKKAVDAMGFENPTEIQAQAIPYVRMGRDIIGRSQTGTRKNQPYRYLLCSRPVSLHCNAPTK